MLYLLYLLGYFLANNLSLKTSYLIAEVVAQTYFTFARKDREKLGANLKVVLGKDTPKQVIDKHVLGVFKNFAKYLADFFRFPRFTEEYLLKNIEIEGRYCLDECLSQGKGVILVAIHLGNWELGAASVGGLKYPISAIVLEHADKRINNFFVHQRAINNVKSIPIGFQIKECFRVLKNNEVLAIVGDKDYTSTGIDVDFFGKKALLPKGPAVFALRTGAPIVFCGLIRKRNDRFKLCFEGPVKYKTTGDEGKDIRVLMGEYLRIFEKYIRKYPDQWYAFRKIWKPPETIQ